MAVLTLNTIDEGWYASNQRHDPFNTNSLTGQYNNGDYNSFFVFDLSNVTTKASSLSFKLQFDSNSDLVANRLETLSFWDVTTDTAALRGASGDVAATWSDLQSGIKYGSTTVTVTRGGVFEVTLSPEAVADYNSHLGKTFAIGVSLDTVNGPLDWVRFGFSSGETLSQLLVTTNSNPVAANDAFTIGETQASKLDLLANDSDADKGDVLTITSVTVKEGVGAVSFADDGKFMFDPGNSYDHLSAGETAKVKLAYTISDGHGGTASAEAVITVQGENDAPTGITLSNASVAENAKGAAIGTLATADVDAHDVHAYSITAVKNAKGETLASNPFEIVNGALKVKDGVALDHETNASYSIEVQSSDGHGGLVAKTFDIAVSDDPSDNGWGAGFELTGVNDWYNPAWGGGFNASFSYTVQESDLKDGAAYAWEILPDYAGKGTVTSAWTNGFNASVATGVNQSGDYALSTDGQAFKQKLVVGDVINFSVQVNGAGYDKKDFAFDFNDLDKAPTKTAPANVAIEAQHTNDWGSGLSQNVSLANLGAEKVDNWSVELDVKDGVNVNVTNVWGASVEKQADGDLVFRALGWNAAIGDHGRANFGFNASYDGADSLHFSSQDFAFLAANHGTDPLLL